MPFRERVRRALKRASTSNGSTSSDDKTSSGKSSNMYQPGEKMPPMKYRRPVANEHKEKLESFNFATAWRRKSHQSVYSPMGSRLPSRKNSLASRRASLVSRKSIERSHAARSSLQAGSTSQPVVEAANDEADVANVGNARQCTRDDSLPKRSKSPARRSRPQSGEHAAEMRGDGRPFGPEDLSLALKKAHLAVPSS